MTIGRQRSHQGTLRWPSPPVARCCRKHRVWQWLRHEAERTWPESCWHSLRGRCLQAIGRYQLLLSSEFCQQNLSQDGRNQGLYRQQILGDWQLQEVLCADDGCTTQREWVQERSLAEHHAYSQQSKTSCPAPSLAVTCNRGHANRNHAQSTTRSFSVLTTTTLQRTKKQRSTTTHQRWCGIANPVPCTQALGWNRRKMRCKRAKQRVSTQCVLMLVMAMEDKIMEIDPSLVRSWAEYEKSTHSNCATEAEEENEHCHSVKCFCPRVLAPDGVTAPLFRQY